MAEPGKPPLGDCSKHERTEGVLGGAEPVGRRATGTDPNITQTRGPGRPRAGPGVQNSAEMLEGPFTKGVSNIFLYKVRR